MQNIKKMYIFPESHVLSCEARAYLESEREKILLSLTATESLNLVAPKVDSSQHSTASDRLTVIHREVFSKWELETQLRISRREFG